jgi:hypothetical protein
VQGGADAELSERGTREVKSQPPFLSFRMGFAHEESVVCRRWQEADFSTFALLSVTKS